MSSALAIAAVSAVLKDLLDSGMIDHQATDTLGRGVTVTARAPDLIELKADMAAQLNLFLYQVTPNSGWRNAALPSRDGAGERLSNPPLALDLHYLVTAYAATDLHAEILLGYAMQLLHETPMLAREAIRTALNPPNAPVDSALPSAPGVLSASDLADQAESIKIVPDYLNPEEMSRVWSALQSRYRPSVAYKATVVLIESRRATRTPLPVLTRGITAHASALPPYPALVSVKQPAGGAPLQLGEALVLEGHHFEGSNARLRLAHPRLDTEFEFAPGAVLGTRIDATLPDQPLDIPAGHHVLSLRVDQAFGGGELRTRISNPLPLAVQPRITGGLAAPVARVGGTATIDLSCAPRLRVGQQVSLIVGSREVFAESFAADTDSARFILRDAAPGTHRVRLRVDGVDSRLVDRGTTPPSFVAGQQVQIT